MNISIHTNTPEYMLIPWHFKTHTDLDTHIWAEDGQGSVSGSRIHAGAFHDGAGAIGAHVGAYDDRVGLYNMWYPPTRLSYIIFLPFNLNRNTCLYMYYIYIYICIYVYIYMYTDTYACVCVCVYIYMCVYDMYACVSVCVYIYISVYVYICEYYTNV